MTLVLICITGAFLISCAVLDQRSGEIPVWLLYSGMLIILAFSAAVRASALYAVVAVCVYFGVSSLSERTEKWIGGADIDAIFSVWLALGFRAWISFMLITSALGCAVLTPLVILKKVDKNERIPIIPLIAIGYAVTIIAEGCGVY